MSFEAQISWKGQHLLNSEVHISWQGQHFLNSEVPGSWQGPHFVSSEVQISGKRSTLEARVTLRVRGLKVRGTDVESRITNHAQGQGSQG